MRRQCMILGTCWNDFVRNTEVLAATNLPYMQDIITTRRNSLFGHVVRLDVHTPAHRACSHVLVLTSTPASASAQVTCTTRGYSRSPTAPLPASVLNGPRLDVMDTPGRRNGPLLSMQPDDVPPVILLICMSLCTPATLTADIKHLINVRFTNVIITIKINEKNDRKNVQNKVIDYKR